MGNNSHSKWDTESEITFIAGCGTGKWSSASSMRATPRRTILANLREAYGQRANWIGIDKKRVMEFLDIEIREEGRAAR